MATKNTKSHKRNQERKAEGDAMLAIAGLRAPYPARGERKRLCLGPFFLLGVLSCLFVFFVANALSAAEPWQTYRGNPERTGSPDGQAGPAAPKVLWVLPAKDHFVASPVPAGDRVYISGLGPFNVPTFYALALDPRASQRVLWGKTTPYLKLPTVSSPAVVEGRLVFGDGMHQTDGATLH